MPLSSRLEWHKNPTIRLYRTRATPPSGKPGQPHAKDYLRAKRAEHKTAREARRAHKRLLANVVVRRTWADHQRRRSRTLNVPNQTTPTAAWQKTLESTFSSVRLRTRVTKGPGSKAAGLAMAFKLLEAAQDRWRAVNGPHLVALVRAGARFDKGVMVERPDEVQEVAA
jgi:hypothetical protein